MNKIKRVAGYAILIAFVVAVWGVVAYKEGAIVATGVWVGSFALTGLLALAIKWTA
jgi:hypothetical protein